MESSNLSIRATHQFTLRTLLLVVVAVAATLGAVTSYGLQGGVAAAAIAFTGFAAALRGRRGVVSPNGLTWLSGLVMLFSVFQVYGYGPMGGGFRLFGLGKYLQTTDPVLLLFVWVEIALLAFGLIAGILAFAQIVLQISWASRRITNIAFLATYVGISGFALIRHWPVTDAVGIVLQILFIGSVCGILLGLILWKLRVAEPRRVALTTAIVVVSSLPTHLPIDLASGQVNVAGMGIGRWMLLVGAGGLLSADIWLWYRGGARGKTNLLRRE